MPELKKDTSSANGPGRPAVHAEDWTKVTVVLMDRQIIFLDRLATDIRARTRTAISRAEIIRALIDGLADSKIDVTNVGCESDLKVDLTSRLRRSEGSLEDS